MSQPSCIPKQIKINFANVYKLYKENSSPTPKLNELIRSQNTSIQLQQHGQVQNSPKNYINNRQHIRSSSDHFGLKQDPIVPKLNMQKQSAIAEGKISIWVTPRSTGDKSQILSSARNTLTSAKPNPYILSSERRSEAITMDSHTNFEKGRASSIISDNFLDSPKSSKANECKNEKKKSNFSPMKQNKVNQENMLVSKITRLLKKHSKRSKNELFKNPFYYYNQRPVTEKDQNSKVNTKSIHFRSQENIGTDQMQSPNKLSNRTNKFSNQKQIEKLQRCISIQTDKLITARNQEDQSIHFDMSPIRIKQQSMHDISSNPNQNKYIPKQSEDQVFAASSSSQHLIFDEQSEKKPQSLSERRQISLHTTITNFSNYPNVKKLTDVIRGKSSDHNSPPRNTPQQSQISQYESNQFKIKLLQNLTQQISIQTDLSKKFQSPLVVSKQEKRISQMIATKMVPQSMSAKEIENIYELRNQNMQNTPCSLQSFLESQLPYQSILERQKQERNVEQNLRKSMNYIAKKNNSQNQSQSNPSSPLKVGINDQTPESLINLDDNQNLQRKCSLILKVPLSPTKEKRSSMDLNFTKFDFEQQNNQAKIEDNYQLNDEKITSNRTSLHKDYAPLRIYKSLSTFSKNGFQVKSQDQQKKEQESPSPKKQQTLLANYIPSKIEKKQSDINNNINKIQINRLFSFAEKANQAIFASENDSKLKKLIDKNIKKLSPNKQKSMNNFKMFRFETNQTEPDQHSNEDSCSPNMIISKFK